jgi:hypothetical protein
MGPCPWWRGARLSKRRPLQCGWRRSVAWGASQVGAKADRGVGRGGAVRPGKEAATTPGAPCVGRQHPGVPPGCPAAASQRWQLLAGPRRLASAPAAPAAESWRDGNGRSRSTGREVHTPGRFTSPGGSHRAIGVHDLGGLFSKKGWGPG